METVKNENLKKEVRNPKTTNYPRDEHSAFCRRCYKKHGKCPSTGGQLKGDECTL